jgi:CBS domain-containing protein
LMMNDRSAFPARDLAVFLAAGVIIVSLVAASVGLPYLFENLELPPEPSQQEEEDLARVAAAEVAIQAVERAQHDMGEDRSDADLYTDAGVRIMEPYRQRIDSRSKAKRLRWLARLTRSSGSSGLLGFAPNGPSSTAWRGHANSLTKEPASWSKRLISWSRASARNNAQFCVKVTSCIPRQRICGAGPPGSVSSERNIERAIANTRRFLTSPRGSTRIQGLKDQFNRPSAYPSYFLIGARVLDEPISSAAGISLVGRSVSSFEAPIKEEPNDEEEILSGSAAGRTATCYSGCSSGPSAREPSRDRGARDRGPVLERCLYDGPRPKPMRRAHVGLREPSLRRAIQECVLKSVGVAPDCWSTVRQQGTRHLKEVVMQVGDVLRKKTSRVVTVRMNETVAIAAQLMPANNISALVVKDVVRTECNTAVGMFTERDVVRAVADHGSAGLDLKISKLISLQLVCCSLIDATEHIRHLMNENHIRHLPVIDNHSLIGVISICDIAGQRASTRCDAPFNRNGPVGRSET